MCLLRFREENKDAHVFLDFTLPFQNKHRDIKSDCERVCVQDVFPHLHTWCSKISTFGMCFHKNMGTRMCILMKIPKWQGNARASHHHRAWKRGCVINGVFIVFSLRLKSVAVLLAQAHPKRCFCQKLFTFRDKN